MDESIGISVEGHVTISEIAPDGQTMVIMERRNAVHKEHMSLLIARAVGNLDNGAVHSMYFGTGGATIDPLGNITYSSPNITGASDLHTPVYFEIVDGSNGAPTGNQMSVKHINGTLFSDLTVRCIIDATQPFGQSATDSSGSNTNTSAFVFDEIGLKDEAGSLLTHIAFSPIEKSANRVIEVIYVLRFTIS